MAKALWRNRRKQYRKLACVGTYDFSNKAGRMLKLTDVNTGKQLVFESHEAAKREGWSQ
jgi:hypothetical protein